MAFSTIRWQVVASSLSRPSPRRRRHGIQTGEHILGPLQSQSRTSGMCLRFPGLKDFLTEARTFVGGERRRLMLLAQPHGGPKGGDKHFTIWTSAEMTPQLGANVLRQFIVDIGGQLAKNVQTPAFTGAVTVRTSGAAACRGRCFPCHELVSRGRHPSCE